MILNFIANHLQQVLQIAKSSARIAEQKICFSTPRTYSVNLNRPVNSAKDSRKDSAKTPDISPSKQVPIPKILRFEELDPCGEEIWIENEGQIYRLRRTRQGKLILTK